ncbi:MAG TPA: hypothetical protein VG993_08115, partial [Actinomycetota bacterium]|nr:hypothetical protein [Actinomycetota bacterium]
EADAPEADAPEADAPEADAPEADAPEADAPEADAPEADAPEADAPYPDVTQIEPPDRRLQIGLVVAAIAVLVGAVLWFTRSSGPPTVPVALRASPTSCDDPCTSVRPQVFLEWAPPESGATATGYRIVRDGTTLASDVGEDDLSFVDETVSIGGTYSYQVVALSDDGVSPPTSPVEAIVPTPPDEAARLHGVYLVKLTVRSARSIGAAFGIENPLPGKRSSDRWSFESTCSDAGGACPSTWSGLEGAIEPIGSRWRGTIDGLPARCGRSGEAPAPIELDLEAIDVGVVDTTWTVMGFRGSAKVSFRCPGFPAASATVEVTGAL